MSGRLCSLVVELSMERCCGGGVFFKQGTGLRHLDKRQWTPRIFLFEKSINSYLLGWTQKLSFGIPKKNNILVQPWSSWSIHQKDTKKSVVFSQWRQGMSYWNTATILSFVAKHNGFVKILLRLQAQQIHRTILMKEFQRSGKHGRTSMWRGGGNFNERRFRGCLDGLRQKVDIKSYSATWIGLTSMALWSPGLHLLEDVG